MCQSDMSWFLVIGVLSSLVSKSVGENHYCINGGIRMVELDENLNWNETIVPQFLSKTSQDQLKKCRWDIKLKTANSGTQLMIAAVPSKNNRSTADGEVEMSVDFLNSNSISVTTGMFQVLQATEHRRFTVEVSWDPRRQAPSSDNLRILLPIPGKCGRDMLQFNGSCYAVSAVRQSMTDATDSVGGDAQLASFSSMAEISEFISANTARQDKLPYRRPLGLKQPVRLGMFHNASAAAVLSAVRSDSGCLLQLVSNSFNFSLTGRERGPCLSLRVTDEDSAVVEFVNCSSPMLSLLSFPETARPAPNSTAHCSGSELIKLVQLKLSYQVSTTLSPSQIHSRRTRIAVFSSVGLGVPLLIGVLVGLACVLYRRQRSFDIRGNNPEGDQQQDPARAVSAISDNNPVRQRNPVMCGFRRLSSFRQSHRERGDRGIALAEQNGNAPLDPNANQP